MASIVAESDRVVGVRFQSTKGLATIGSIPRQAELEYFNQNRQLIGFYGTKTETGQVTSLGFLTHDPNCNVDTIAAQ